MEYNHSVAAVTSTAIIGNCSTCAKDCPLVLGCKSPDCHPANASSYGVPAPRYSLTMPSLSGETEDDLEPVKLYDCGDWMAGATLYFCAPLHIAPGIPRAAASNILFELQIESVMYGANISRVVDESVTHVIAFCNAGSKLTYFQVVCSLPPDEQRAFLNEAYFHRQILVKKTSWLEDCFTRKQILE